MREVQIIKWCDICHLEGGEDGEYRQAVDSWTVGASNGENNRPVPKVLDLCEAHGKAIGDLVELLGQIDQLPGPSKPVAQAAAVPYKPTEWRTCPVCQTETPPNDLVRHIWTNHRTDAKPPIPKVCPECGERFDKGAGMSAHRRITHGYDTLADALSGVKGFKQPKAHRDQPELAP